MSETNPPRTSLDAEASLALRALLVDIFPSADALRGFVRRAPGLAGLHAEQRAPTCSIGEFVDDLIALAERHGLLGPLLEALSRDFPAEAPRLNPLRARLCLSPLPTIEPTNDLLMDNWAYQDITELFIDGPSDIPIEEIRVGEELSAIALPWPAVALESLLATLSGVALHDRFMVEEKQIGAWNEDGSPLIDLAHRSIIQPIPEPEDLPLTRSGLYQRLFVAPPLARAHQLLRAARNDPARSRGHEHLSSVLWGSVGYVARSAHLGVPYCAHPVRRRFLRQTPFTTVPDALTLTVGAIDRARAERFLAIKQATSLSLDLTLPPILVAIINDARTRDDLVPVALQLRNEFRDLRRWIALFNQALRDPAANVDRILEYQHTLQKVAEAASLPGVHRYHVVSQTIDNMPGPHRQAGLIMERLIQAKPGVELIDKLIGLFEIRRTSLATRVKEHLRTALLAPA
jgi:hypothetical protein